MDARHRHNSPGSNTTVTTLLERPSSSVPTPTDVMIALVEVPAGDPGTPPHRHSGPVYGYVLEGEMDFELEGEPPRVLRAGEAFWEPGGDVIHYRSANTRTDRPLKFIAVMVGLPGQPMLTLVPADELTRRRHLRWTQAAADGTEPDHTEPDHTEPDRAATGRPDRGGVPG